MIDNIILGLILALGYGYGIYISFKYEQIRDNYLKIIHELNHIIIEKNEEIDILRRLP